MVQCEEGNTTEPDVAWISKTDYEAANTDETSCSYDLCTDEGPVTALTKLNERTSGWSNIPEMTYTLSGLDEKGTKKYKDMTVTSKARLITYAESNSVGCTKSNGSCPNWMYENLNSTGDNNTAGYWTSTSNGISTTWIIYFFGISTTSTGSFGLRPVIE